MMSLLELHNIRLEFANRVIFDNLDFTLTEGETICIETGVLDGGSSFLKLCAGLLAPNSGEIKVSQTHYAQLSESEKFATACYCFEQGGLLSVFSNFNNIAFPLLYHTGKSRSDVSQLIYHSASLFNVQELLHLEPHQLNDVQTRLMNLVRAIVYRPKIILIDELQSGMSATIRDMTLNKLMDEQAKYGFAIVMTTTAGDLTHFAARTLRIQSGKLMELK